MGKKVDKTKKSNIKCEHCSGFDNDKERGGWCCILQTEKNTGIDVNILCGNMIFEASTNVVSRG